VNNALLLGVGSVAVGRRMPSSFCNRFCWVWGFIGVSLGIVGIGRISNGIKRHSICPLLLYSMCLFRLSSFFSHVIQYA
jgi:hypothetical protein